MKAALALWRLWLAPAALTVAAGLGFTRAFDRADLVGAIAVSVVVGGLTGALAGRRVQLLPRWWSAVVPALAVLAGYALAIGIVGRAVPTPSFIQDAVTTFLLVGLPAPGLDSVAIVIPIVLYPAMTLATWASFHRHTLTTVAAPIVALGIAGLLVAPVGMSWWVPVVLATVIGAVLMSDVRNDLVSLPALVGTGTELRRQLPWWRPLAQALPVLAALVAAATLVPTADTWDVRQYVHPGTVTVPDPSPLAVAARWRQDDDPTPVARVEVDGARPGRLRLAVLDEYEDTGWEQAASYQITGDIFPPDPVFPTDRPGARSSTVTVTPRTDVGFRAVPSAGALQSVTNPNGIRFAPDAGAILADDRDRTVTYTTDSSATAPPEADVPLVGSYPPSLAACPDSDVLQSAAQQLTANEPSATGRLAAIEDWLLTRRIYDPSGPGGQTLGSVEQFVRQPFARGNLEAFVTTFALMGRCAGVPTRAVVGFPAPERGRTDLNRDDVSAWVEVPLERVGWAPFDPVPTPEEQELQAEQAEEQQTTSTTEPTAPTTPPREVEPTVESGPGFPWIWVLVALLVIALLALWTFLTPLLVGRRRRRIADPTAAVLAAWTTATDALAVRDTGVGPQHTPTEVVRVGAGELPVSVPGLLAGLAPIVDRTRYSGEPASEDDAALAWAYVDAVEDRLGHPWVARLQPLLHPGRQLTRLRSTQGPARRAEPWKAELPDTALISSSDAPDDIQDVSIEARIGDGATGTVYRGVHVPSGRQVAVKVFRYGPNDPGFDENRFDWEVRIAREVSGLPHLPEVLSAGITPMSGRPYLVSTLYDEGTLLDRVRRGGPMTAAESVAIGADIAAGLEAMHQLGVIHSDVKPENVFASEGSWVLGDLGSAWLRASRGPAASLTPPYAAPEVWRGSSPTPEADVYSLALTMLYARTGQVPIAGNPPTPDDIVAAFPDLPIMLRALDPDARRRPRSVADLGRVLRPGFFAGVAGGRVVTISLATPATEPADSSA